MDDDIQDALRRIRSALEAKADGATREGTRRFFKEPVTPHGVKAPMVALVAREARTQLKAWPKAEVFALCEGLWRSGFLEESFVASDLAYNRRKGFEPADFATFERWVASYVANWASCDTLCNHTIGWFLEAFPDHVRNLVAWSGSTNRWVRRAAAVSLVIPAQKGLFLDEALAIADRLMADPDDLVQKGYGWLLKSASKVHEAEIFAFVSARRAVMPRTALRYAIEKMPPAMRAEAMRKT
jgi:3-methyladenine DNA glycosylase AlkD